MGRMREVLDSAQDRAKEIVSDAEDKARDLIANAEDEARTIRDRAEDEAQQRLAQVRDALIGIEGAITSSPAKAAANEPSAEIDPGPVEVPEPMPPVEPEPSPPAEPEPMPPDEPEPFPSEPEIEPPAPAEPDRESPEMVNGFRGERSHDATAARIVAMKMALDGADRDQISGHLDDNYDIEASEKLLDDVMTRAKR